MQLILPIIAISIVTVVGLFGSRAIITLKQKSDKRKTTPTVTQTIESPTPILTDVSEKPVPSTAASTATPAQPPQTDNTNSNFTYPGAQTTGNGEYTSGDDPDVITNWYKDKIKDMGFNTKSFVTTKTNDNVNNVLAAANGYKQIKVTIARASGESTTQIKITQ